MRLVREPPAYAELVFHVLAHVRSDVPASLYDPAWIELAARHLGAAGGRTLAEDAVALRALAPDHAALASAQLVAWLFRDLERASACAARPLEELGPDDVGAPELLAPLMRVPAAAELLRLAAELETPFFRRLPAADVDYPSVEAALSTVACAAPGLDGCAIALLRPLRLRGRVRGDVIWVGVPDAQRGPTPEHVAWQAAHEATVREVGALDSRDERRVEQMAVVLLAMRADRVGARTAHRRWLAHFGPNVPGTNEDTLSPGELAQVHSLVAAAAARSGT
ncbi:MAG: hypothetical protein HYZ29_18950 [Myxococcales bacterium]|nr:hypothetical protein [Myxococcales bacterium]